MLTRVSTKGQTVIPAAIREMAKVTAGDELDVGYFGGMIILRKQEPLTPRRMRSMILAGHRLPEMTAKDERAVEGAVRRARLRTAR